MQWNVAILQKLIFNRLFSYTRHGGRCRVYECCCRSVRILFWFFRAVLYTNTTKEMQRNVLNANNITTVKWSVKTLLIFVLYGFFCSFNLYIVYSTVSTLYYLTIISNMCNILQILFVSEMVNNFY